MKIKTLLRLIGAKDRSEVFSILFSEQEQTAIINSLYRRSEQGNDERQSIKPDKQDELLRSTCKQLAKELMS